MNSLPNHGFGFLKLFEEKRYSLGFLAVLVLFQFGLHFKSFSLELVGIHAWRQTQTQTHILNFAYEDANILNPRINNRGDESGIQRMEFPIMQWLFSWPYRWFGNQIELSRAMSFLLYLLSLIGFYALLRMVSQAAWLAVFGAWALSFSPALYYYAVSPLPDNFALCAGIWGLAFSALFFKKPKRLHVLLAFGFLALSALAKLPFIIWMAFPFTLLLLQFWKKKKSRSQMGLDMFLALAGLTLPLIWYSWVIPQWPGGGIMKGITENELDSQTTLNLLVGNVVSVFPELMLNYAALPLFVIGVFFSFRFPSRALLYSLGITLFGLVCFFLFEINVIGTAHDYYLFPFLPFLFLGVCYGAKKMMESRYLKHVVLACFLAMPVLAVIRIQHRWDEGQAPGFNKDLVTHHEALIQASPKNELVIAGNDLSGHIFLYYIQKKGWAFTRDELTETELADRIQKGARYLYTDSPRIQNDVRLAQHFQTKVLDAGSIAVYLLK